MLNIPFRNKNVIKIVYQPVKIMGLCFSVNLESLEIQVFTETVFVVICDCFMVLEPEVPINPIFADFCGPIW